MSTGIKQLSLQVVEVSARYDDTCISGDTHQQRDTNLVQVSLRHDTLERLLAIILQHHTTAAAGRCWHNL